MKENLPSIHRTIKPINQSSLPYLPLLASISLFISSHAFNHGGSFNLSSCFFHGSAWFYLCRYLLICMRLCAYLNKYLVDFRYKYSQCCLKIYLERRYKIETDCQNQIEESG